MDKIKEKIFSVGGIMRALAIALVAAGVIICISWWEMPYIHTFFSNYAVIILLHLAVLLLSIVQLVLTFLFAERKIRLCMIFGFVTFILSAYLMIADLNQGFLPREDMLVIAMLSFCYVIVSVIASIPVKDGKAPDKGKSRLFCILSAISSVVAAFSIGFPKGHLVEITGMHEDGPMEIFTQIEYTAFDYVLYALIPIGLIAFVVFLSLFFRARGNK